MPAPKKKIRLLLAVGGAVLFLVGLAVATRLLPSILTDEPPRDNG